MVLGVLGFRFWFGVTLFSFAFSSLVLLLRFCGLDFGFWVVSLLGFGISSFGFDGGFCGFRFSFWFDDWFGLGADGFRFGVLCIWHNTEFR